jgi:hypothetical protein
MCRTCNTCNIGRTQGTFTFLDVLSLVRVVNVCPESKQLGGSYDDVVRLLYCTICTALTRQNAARESPRLNVRIFGLDSRLRRIELERAAFGVWL